jgi:ABC-type transporter lipoprotein component MlaA
MRDAYLQRRDHLVTDGEGSPDAQDNSSEAEEVDGEKVAQAK